MNGIKNKFSSESVLKIFEKFTLLIINETHFGVRSKCPAGLLLIGRSRKIQSKSPRGGVAIYKSLLYPLLIDVLYEGLKDCRINTVIL